MNIYVIHDSASETFDNPMTIPTDRDAKAGFATVANDDQTKYGKFPLDFTLIKIGKFDQRKGYIETHDPIVLCTAASLLKS